MQNDNHGVQSLNVAAVHAQAHVAVESFLSRKLFKRRLVPLNLEGVLGKCRDADMMIFVAPFLMGHPGGDAAHAEMRAMHQAQGVSYSCEHALYDILVHETLHSTFFEAFIDDVIDAAAGWKRFSHDWLRYGRRPSGHPLIFAVNEAFAYAGMDKMSGHRHFYPETAEMYDAHEVQPAMIRFYYETLMQGTLADVADIVADNKGNERDIVTPSFPNHTSAIINLL